MSAMTLLRGQVKKAVDESRGVNLTRASTFLLNDLLNEKDVLEQKAAVWEYLTWKLDTLNKELAVLEDKILEAGERRHWYWVGVYSEDYRKLSDEVSEIRSLLAVDRKDFVDGDY